MTPLHYLTLAIPLLPFLAACWIILGFIIGWNSGERGERETARVLVGAELLALLLLLVLGGYSLLFEPLGLLSMGAWLKSGAVQADFGFLLDPLSLWLSICFSLVILIATRFSINYLHREAGFQRYFIVLALFHTAVLLVTLGADLLLVFVGWELAGISSWVLIAYRWQRDWAVNNANRAFVTNRIGDATFLLALFIALVFLGVSSWPMIFNAAATHDSMLTGLLGFSLILPALIKSAQFPFSAWISRALEGPTPSSAVFYGSVLSHLALYLLIRLAPLLEMVNLLQWFLLSIGLLTVCYAWLSAQAQTDIKTSLIYATLMQTGLIVNWIALGWYDLASLHLTLHLFWRAHQFLNAPSFMQQAQRPAQLLPRWLRRHTSLYLLAAQRCWLDPLTDWFLVRPTQQLAQEAQLFDEQVLNRLTGTPTQSALLSSLAQAQDFQQGRHAYSSAVGVGTGVLGKLMQTVAEWLEWFENKLVLGGSGETLSGLANTLGEKAEIIESYLRKPRYLMVLIAATLVYIL
ncbi:MAG: hypothetical protein CR991_07810 [Proteobacteria bacterium]|nr:MAG: hypothetical protein CR991_07810 [Pseudomonadota bacterium]